MGCASSRAPVEKFVQQAEMHPVAIPVGPLCNPVKSDAPGPALTERGPRRRTSTRLAFSDIARALSDADASPSPASPQSSRERKARVTMLQGAISLRYDVDLTTEQVEEVATMMPEGSATTRTEEFEELVRSVQRAGEVQGRLAAASSHKSAGGRQLAGNVEAAIEMIHGSAAEEPSDVAGKYDSAEAAEEAAPPRRTAWGGPETAP